MGRTKAKPRVAPPRVPPLPAGVDPRDFSRSLADRRRFNVLFGAAQSAYNNYVAVLAQSRGEALDYDDWFATQVQGPHPAWSEIEGMERLYSELDLSQEEANRRSASRAAVLAGGGKLPRPPKKKLATKAACLPLPTGGSAAASSSRSRRGAEGGGGDTPSDDEAGAADSDASPVVDLTQSDDEFELGDAAECAPGSADAASVLSVRSAPVSRAASDSRVLGRAQGSGASVGAPPAPTPGSASVVAAARSLILRVPRRPDSPGGRVAYPLVAPFHVFVRGQPDALFIRAAVPGGAAPPSLNVFRVPPSGSYECCLRYGVSPTGLPWECSHAACDSRRVGLDHPAAEARYYCAHHHDICVPCAERLSAPLREGSTAPVAVPLADAPALVFDAYQRETVTEAEGE